MNVEENRLSTFSDWPTNAAVDAARIAKAGFYYSGCALEVQCFLCGIKISDWNYGDQAIVRHRQAAPDCPFVKNPLETCNVPMVPTSSYNSTLASSSTETLQGAHTAESQSVISLSQSNNSQGEYRSFQQRLQSFANWPISSIVSPKELAKAGFYYLQQDDTVQCIYCGGVIRKWLPGDVPDLEHRVHFPKCDFYMHQDDNDTLHLANVKLMPGTTTNLAELGIQTHSAPKVPNCATYEKRLSTFYGWPENLKQTPEMLSSAGFYYSGYGDHVRCFHCDGGLRNWEATDDVWTEHARWFPRCEFVNLVRGQEFIEQCINNRAPLDPSIFGDVPEDEVTDIVETSPSLPAVSPPTQEVTETTMERLSESPGVVEATAIPCTNPDQITGNVLSNQFMEDDSGLENETFESSSSELITLPNRGINEQENTSTEQCDDVEGINADDKIIVDKNKILLTTEETSIRSNESNTLDKKTGVECKETTGSLEEENRRLKEARLCKVCMDREVAIVFLPCGHLATCVHCAPSLTYCPMCREEIRATVRTFLS